MINKEIDCDSTDEVVCPYCGYKHENDCDKICNQDEDEEFYCHNCDKVFIYTPYFTVTFSSRKCNCLNDVPHNWTRKQKHNDYGDKEYWWCDECGKHEWREKNEI